VNRLRASWRDPSGFIASASLLAGVIVLGLITEDAEFGLKNPRRWVPDLLVGAGLAGFGLFALRLRRLIGALLVAAGLTWFMGNLVPVTLYIHRGLILHAVSTYPGWRTGTSAGTGLLALGYLFACWLPLASTDLGTALFGLVVTSVASIRPLRSKGRPRRPRRVALNAALFLLAGSTGSVFIRITAGSSGAVEPALVLYQAALVAVAAILALGLRTPSPGSIADLVVEIGESRRSTVRDAMARLLDDPLLEFGVRQPDGTYVDTQGAPIDIPDEVNPRIATRVGQGTRSDAVIVHDRTLLADNSLLDAVTSVTRLSSVHAELTAQARHQLTQLTAARRRLLTSEDEERRRLSKSLHDRTEPNLFAVEELLVSIVSSNEGDSAARNAAQNALGQLRVAHRDLDTIARGLHPWESSSDLETALVAMAGQAPVPVSVIVAALPERYEVASAVYYMCSEAVTNAVKHASADHIEIELIQSGGALTATVTDDGQGGADPSMGTGLAGLVDRVAGLGGVLVVKSQRGAGTRLTATFSLEGDA
jgi:signal transduction histidine kinase